MVKSKDNNPGSPHDNAGLLEQDLISSPSLSERHQHKRILIVDDNADIAFTLRVGLENNDIAMQVHSYDNPLNALLNFKPNFYDLLLIDVNMPLMDGFELCSKILQKDITSKCVL